MADRMGGAGVQLGGRLVDEQQVGFRADGAGQHQPLRLASGQVREPAFGRISQVEQFHGGHRLRFGVAPPLPFGQQREDHMIEGAAFRHAVRVLEHPADPVDAVAFHAAFGRPFPSGQDGQQRGFAAAGWSADRNRMPRFDREVEVFEQGVGAGEPMRQTVRAHEHDAPAIAGPILTVSIDAASVPSLG